MKTPLILMYFLAQLSALHSEECVSHKNTPGVCTPDRECKYVHNIFRRKKDWEIRNEMSQMVLAKCRNELDFLILCCPVDAVSTSTIDLSTTITVPSAITSMASTKKSTESSRVEEILISRSKTACDNFGNRPPFIAIVRKIINGTEAKPYEVAPFAALGYEDSESRIAFKCGGALISEYFVLTAAHCCKKGLKMVRLGKNDLNDFDENDEGFDYNISEIIKHPDRQERQKYHDIALLRLEVSVYFTHAIWPACLPQQKEYLGIPLLIAGFGKTNVANNPKNELLMRSTIEEIPLEECKENYASLNMTRMKMKDGITNDLICAKNREYHTDTCQGDSGSGLFYISNDTFTAVGVTSFGLSCNTSLPSFYTRVASYREWIEEIVWPSL